MASINDFNRSQQADIENAILCFLSDTGRNALKQDSEAIYRAANVVLTHVRKRLDEGPGPDLFPYHRGDEAKRQIAGFLQRLERQGKVTGYVSRGKKLWAHSKSEHELSEKLHAERVARIDGYIESHGGRDHMEQVLRDGIAKLTPFQFHRLYQQYAKIVTRD